MSEGNQSSGGYLTVPQEFYHVASSNRSPDQPLVRALMITRSIEITARDCYLLSRQPRGCQVGTTHPVEAKIIGRTTDHQKRM